MYNYIYMYVFVMYCKHFRLTPNEKFCGRQINKPNLADRKKNCSFFSDGCDFTLTFRAALYLIIRVSRHSCTQFSPENGLFLIESHEIITCQSNSCYISMVVCSITELTLLHFAPYLTVCIRLLKILLTYVQ